MPVCKLCQNELSYIFADLGTMPLANSYAKKDAAETCLPLRVYVCEKCMLVQVLDIVSPDSIFSEYSYLSSVSQGWLRHCKEYCDMMMHKYNINPGHFIVEVASNDGHLLKNFVDRSIPVLGVEPAKNIAGEAIKNGVPTLCDFFGTGAAGKIITEHRKADFILGNNVLAHVPNVNDFAGGLKLLLKEQGVITLEFPHLLNMITENQFDTIYHEHFFYFSLITVSKIMQKQKLRIFDIDELETHGGSLRVYICHENDDTHPTVVSVQNTLDKELKLGLGELETYINFGKKIQRVKRDAVRYLIGKKEDGKRIAAFGAAAKGSTFLNYCGIGRDLIDYVVDQTPYKQGLCMPGVQIPIYPVEKVFDDKPDIIVILPWNWTDDIVKKISFIEKYGGKAVTFIPGIKEFL